MISRPQPNEYNDFNATYINKVGDQPVLELLTDLKKNTHAMFSNIPPAKEEFAYAEGKWTIKEVVAHMIDTERVFQYRLMAFSRGEKQPLPGFEQDDYAKEAFANERILDDLADEFRAVRDSTLYIVRNLKEHQLNFIGTSAGAPLSTRALIYMIAGHELHHLEVLRERYLVKV
jgi:uncharacterized damage-inducible protein DinB